MKKPRKLVPVALDATEITAIRQWAMFNPSNCTIKSICDKIEDAEYTAQARKPSPKSKRNGGGK